MMTTAEKMRAIAEERKRDTEKYVGYCLTRIKDVAELGGVATEIWLTSPLVGKDLGKEHTELLKDLDYLGVERICEMLRADGFKAFESGGKRVGKFIKVEW